jgi:hypothetical protein
MSGDDLPVVLSKSEHLVGGFEVVTMFFGMNLRRFHAVFGHNGAEVPGYLFCFGRPGTPGLRVVDGYAYQKKVLGGLAQSRLSR